MARKTESTEAKLNQPRQLHLESHRVIFHTFQLKMQKQKQLSLT